MTVSIVTVYFLIPPFSLISYITIYILISYVVFRKGYKYFFLIVTTETVTDSAVRYSLFFFSKASHHEEFLGSLAAEVTEGVILRVLWQAEVRLEAAVGPARHIDAVALVDQRIAPREFPLLGIFDERVVLPSVACEHAPVVLSHFSSAVACQDSF